MENLFIPNLEASGTIRHHTLALSGSNGSAEIGFPRFAEFAFAALCSIDRHDMVSNCYVCHSLSNRFDDSSSFVPKDHRENAFRIFSAPGIFVGMADPGIKDLDSNFVGLWRGHFDILELERFTCAPAHRSLALDDSWHIYCPLMMIV